jgi:AcrR family transcriptional regulator
MDTAWRLVRLEGTQGLSLGRLADAAGITKPVVYDHFATKSELLISLYQEFDLRQNQLMDEAIASRGTDLESCASVLASTYVDCVLAQGAEIPGVVAALSGSPDLQKVKAEAELAFQQKWLNALAPFSPAAPSVARMAAILGAAEALAKMTLAGEIAESAAKAELADLIIAVVQGAHLRRRSPRGNGR